VALSAEDEWLWGWDATPRIVSVWADYDGRAFVWRRVSPDPVVRDEVPFRPWILPPSLEDLAMYTGQSYNLADSGATPEGPVMVHWFASVTSKP